ncbi:reverse transcriptase domain-containing protein [Tanacetum coccineum]
MYIELANKTTQFPKGITKNVMVKIDKVVFPVDFVILDMEEDHRIPIILGRPFLATSYAMIDVFNKKISFKVGDETIIFDLEKSIRFPHQMRTPTILRIKQNAKPRLIRWVSLLQEFTIEIKDKKGTKNLAADHFSRLETPGLEELNEDTIQDNFPDEHLMIIKLKITETDPKEWADKLDDALWAFRTTYKIPIGSTPFRIVYEKACHLPIELEHKAYWALKNINLDLDVAGKHRFLQLNQLDEFRTEAYEHSRASKERTKRWHDPKIMDKEFQEGEENSAARRQLSRPARLIIMWHASPFDLSSSSFTAYRSTMTSNECSKPFNLSWCPKQILHLLLKNLLKSLTAMSYSSSSLPEVEHSSSLDSFLAFKDRDLLSPLGLTISESFLMIIAWTLRFPMSSSRDSDVKFLTLQSP